MALIPSLWGPRIKYPRYSLCFLQQSRDQSVAAHNSNWYHRTPQKYRINILTWLKSLASTGTCSGITQQRGVQVKRLNPTGSWLGSALVRKDVSEPFFLDCFFFYNLAKTIARDETNMSTFDCTRKLPQQEHALVFLILKDFYFRKTSLYPYLKR